MYSVSGLWKHSTRKQYYNGCFTYTPVIIGSAQSICVTTVWNTFSYSKVSKVKLRLVCCHPPQLRPTTTGLRDSFNCLQSLPQPIALMSLAARQVSVGCVCSLKPPASHRHCHWNSTTTGFEPSPNQHLPAGSRHAIYWPLNLLGYQYWYTNNASHENLCFVRSGVVTLDV